MEIQNTVLAFLARRTTPPVRTSTAAVAVGQAGAVPQEYSAVTALSTMRRASARTREDLAVINSMKMSAIDSLRTSVSTIVADTRLTHKNHKTKTEAITAAMVQVATMSDEVTTVVVNVDTPEVIGRTPRFVSPTIKTRSITEISTVDAKIS